jgi:hypothetical protein
MSLNTRARKIRKPRVVATTLETTLAKSPTTIDGSAAYANSNPSCSLQALNSKGQQEPDDLQLKASRCDRMRIFLENRLVMPLKTVSMYLRIGLLKNSSHAGSGRLEFFLRCAFRCNPAASSSSRSS